MDKSWWKMLPALALLAACSEPRPQDGDPAAAGPEEQRPTSATRVSGAIPEPLLKSVRAELAARLEVDEAEITVREQQAVTWNDGSLGCPKPGYSYTQALVDGYRIILEHSGRTYAYHTNDRGYFLLCENPPADLGGRIDPRV